MKSSFLKLAIVAALMALPFIASAQVYVGGSLAGSLGSSPNASTKSWAFSIHPEVGYVLNDNWAIGGRFSYGKAVSTMETANNKVVNTQVDAFAINPYAAYSPFRRGNFALWAEFGLQFVPAQNGVNHSAYGAYAVPVLTYDLGEHFALKSNLGFASVSVGGTSDGDFTFGASVGNESDLSIGVVYKF